jgi:RNA polymerase sigma factor (sigma-70 family)
MPTVPLTAALRDLSRRSDRQLLEAFLARRDETSFAALVERYGGLVLGVCRRVLGHRQDAEDVFQATFLVLARQASGIRRRGSVSCWLHGVAWRLAQKARVRAARRRTLERLAVVNAAPADPPGAAAERELAGRLDEVLVRLPEKYRRPLVLCHLEGRTLVEAARLIGCPKGTVAGRLARGRDLLRRRLVSHGLLPAGGVAAVLGGDLTAAVPPAVRSTAVRTALSGAAEVRIAGAPVSAARLTREALPSMSPIKLTFALGVACGLALAALGLNRESRPAAAHEPPPAAAARTDPASEEVRTDRFGDPLPPGALARFGSTRFRHGGNVRGLVYYPDGKRLASAGQDNTLRVWDAATGKELLRMRPFEGEAARHVWVLAVARSPDGRFLVSTVGNGPGAVVLWDAATGREVRRFRSDSTKSESILFTPDGRSVVVGDSDGKVECFDVESGKAVREFTGDVGWVRALALARDGKTLAVAGEGLKLFDLSSGQFLREIGGHSGTVVGLAFSPDGAVLASASQFLVLTETTTGRQLNKPAGAASGPVAFSPDGTVLATGSGFVELRDPRTGEVRKQLPPVGRPPQALAFSPDGMTLAAGGWDGTVDQFDVATGQRKGAVAGHRGEISAVAVSRDGRLVASGGESDGVIVWDAATGQVRHRLAGRSGQNGRIDEIAFAADDRSVRAGGWDYTVREWNLDTGKLQREKRFEGVGFRFAPDGRTVAHGKGPKVVVSDLSTGKPLHKFDGAEDWVTAAYSPDGTLLACAGKEQDGTIHLWDTATGKLARSVKGQEDGPRAVAFSPDGRLLATGGGYRRVSVPESVVHLWDVATGKEVGQCRGRLGSVTAVAFAPDGRTLAASGGGGVALYEVATGSERRQFAGHTGIVWSIAFDPHGRWMVTGCSDKTVLQWDLIGRPDVARSAERDLERSWADLAGDPVAADRARAALVAEPARTVPFLAGRVKPAPVAEAGQVPKLVADLNSDRSAVRRQAMLELERLGELAEPDLRRASQAAGASLEVRKRLDELLGRLVKPTGETLRALRAVEVLEQIGTPDARAVLTTLAGGPDGARLTRDAAGALRRMGG